MLLVICATLHSLFYQPVSVNLRNVFTQPFNINGLQRQQRVGGFLSKIKSIFCKLGWLFTYIYNLAKSYGSNQCDEVNSGYQHQWVSARIIRREAVAVSLKNLIILLSYDLGRL